MASDSRTGADLEHKVDQVLKRLNQIENLLDRQSNQVHGLDTRVAEMDTRLNALANRVSKQNSDLFTVGTRLAELAKIRTEVSAMRETLTAINRRQEDAWFG